MKKKIVGIFLILLAGLVMINNNGEKLLLKADSYGVDYNIGRVFDPIERHEINQLVEQASVDNYNQAIVMIDEMVANGYDESQIPLVLYSGVTTNELGTITNMYDTFMVSLSKEEVVEPIATEVIVDDDADNDGVADEYDVCPSGNDLVDSNYNLIPDECEQVENGVSITTEPVDDTNSDISTDDKPVDSAPEDPPVDPAPEEPNVGNPGDGTEEPGGGNPGDGTEEPDGGDPGAGTEEPPVDPGDGAEDPPLEAVPFI